jgi:hypothetical protein
MRTQHTNRRRTTRRSLTGDLLDIFGTLLFWGTLLLYAAALPGFLLRLLVCWAESNPAGMAGAINALLWTHVICPPMAFTGAYLTSAEGAWPRLWRRDR